MPEETLRYRVDFDESGLQAQLQRQHAGIGAGLGSLFAAPGQVAGMAFSSAQADLTAARTVFASPTLPGLPFSPGPSGMQFFDPAAQVGFFRGLGMQAGILPPPPSALTADIQALQSIQMQEFMVRAPAGIAMRFAMPAVTGAIGAGVGAALGIPFGGIGGAVVGSLAGSVLGEAAYGAFAAGRDRGLILQALGGDETRSMELGRMVGGIFAEPQFGGIKAEEFQEFFGQQAFARQMAPQTSRDVQKAFSEFREDLRALSELRAGLNLTFDEATQLFGGLQAVGVRPGMGDAAGDPGTTRAVTAGARTLRQFGFTPSQIRGAVLGDIQAAQTSLLAGASPGGILSATGGLQFRAGTLFRFAQGGEDPFFEGLLDVAPTPQVMAGALERATRGIAGFGIVRQAAIAAQLELPAGERGDVTAVLGGMQDLLVAGPGAINLAIQRSRQELGTQFGGAVIAAQGRVPGVVEGMLRSPGASVQAFETMRRFAEIQGGQALGGPEFGNLLQGMGLDPQAVKAAVGEWVQVLERGAGDFEVGLRRHMEIRGRAEEENARQIQENQEKVAVALTAQIGGGVRGAVGAVGGAFGGFGEFVGRQNEILGRYFGQVRELASIGYAMSGADPTPDPTGLREAVTEGFGRTSGTFVRQLMQTGMSREEAERQVSSMPMGARIRGAITIARSFDSPLDPSVVQHAVRRMAEVMPLEADLEGGGTSGLIRQALSASGEMGTTRQTEVFLEKALQILSDRPGLQPGEAELRSLIDRPGGTSMVKLAEFVSQFAESARRLIEQMEQSRGATVPRSSEAGT